MGPGLRRDCGLSALRIRKDRRAPENKSKHMTNLTTVDYDGLIPNKIGLNADPRLRRALESWHPGCVDWWRERGPEGFQANLVYLRTAISVEPEGWAKFDYVRMPEYRWGVLLAPAIDDRRNGFGA